MKSFTLFRFSLFAMLVLGALGASAALAQNADKDKKKADQPASTAPAPTPAEAKALAALNVTAAAAVDPNTYKIGAEDVLEVRVWKEPELSGQHRVRPDGKITLPLVGEIQASGLTPSELKAKTTEAFSSIMNAPQVIVSVIAVESKKYFVLGSVGRSGPFPLVMPTTVLQALSICGFSEWAKKSGIIIMRGDKRLKFNYNQVIKGKNPDQNILLEDGDQIMVP
jgi:polysaccharide export outer membrane protein